MSWKDLPVVGQIASALSLLLDMILNGGEFVVAFVWIAIENVDLVLSFVVTLNRLADRLPFLPSDVVQKVATAMFAAMLIVYLGRLVSQIGDNENES